MVSDVAGRHSEWVIEFEANKDKWVNPLMGWTSASNMSNAAVQLTNRLRFSTQEQAENFAKSQG